MVRLTTEKSLRLGRDAEDAPDNFSRQWKFFAILLPKFQQGAVFGRDSQSRRLISS